MTSTMPQDDTLSKPALGLLLLVVEDDASQRAQLVSLLESMGARDVHEAADGRTALEMVRELDQPFDVIITDIDMPDMDGLALIRGLAQIKVGASLVIISRLDNSLLESVGRMCAAYGSRLLGSIQKPASEDELARLLALHRPAGASLPLPESPDEFSVDEMLAGLDREEFVPFYQPKIELATGLVRGAEALARWRHPSRGIVLPQHFIHALEAGERIDALTWVMLAKAAAECRQWRANGLDLTVSVNISATLLNDISVAEAITWQVRNQGLDPGQMILEITESCALTDNARVLENLARLRLKGFGLSIDDFGTGYSSIEQLTRVPFTELKIDQSFVLHASRQESARVILESSLDMARKLHIASVAEGAEHQADWDLLRSLGCDYVQGYFIAPPVDSQQFRDWVRNWG